jgi:hypothetical protein
VYGVENINNVVNNIITELFFMKNAD